MVVSDVFFLGGEKNIQRIFLTKHPGGFPAQVFGGFFDATLQAGIAGPGGEVPLSRVGGAQHPTFAWGLGHVFF